MTQLILFGVLSVAAFLVWLGYHFLQGLARAFGNSSGPDISWVLIVVGIGTAVCALGSFFAPASIARLVALAPLALILLGHGFIAYEESACHRLGARPEPGDRAAQQRKLQGISRDYVLQDEFTNSPDGRNFAFLTHDRESNSIVQITDAYAFKLHVAFVGKIDGKHLDTLDPPDHLRTKYGRYLDSEGKSILDRYTIRHRPDLDTKSSLLKKYRL
jgi:hypothetical protein